jgi:hypothetical protein
MDLPDVGLLIDEPYISMILKGDKTWEMRSQRTGKRERIGLIKKGSCAVYGTIELYDCEGPISKAELKNQNERHGISVEQIDAGLLDKWNYAWKLKDVQVFKEPIPYNHPNGAVTWVNLTKALSSKLISDTVVGLPVTKTIQVATENLLNKPDVSSTLIQESSDVPVAKDGTVFGEHLGRGGYFTVGEKGEEQKIYGYKSALVFLKSMKKAKWRRPNDKGNWGIVSAADWR